VWQVSAAPQIVIGRRRKEAIMDMHVQEQEKLTSIQSESDPSLRRLVEHLLSNTVEKPCYRSLCRKNGISPNAVYTVIDDLTDQLKLRDERIRAQEKTIERLRFQLVELIKQCTSRRGGPCLQ
jgi:hypothetical protein